MRHRCMTFQKWSSIFLTACAPSPHPFQSSSLLRTGLLFGDAFSKEDEVSKGVSDKKLLETPRLGLQRRPNGIGRQILLVQGIDIDNSDPTHRVAFGASEQ